MDRNPAESRRTSNNPTVALLAEGVDRNQLVSRHKRQLEQSPSSRRAWIEIALCLADVRLKCVALLAEGVDRNGVVYSTVSAQKGRPPRGGRG